MKAALEVAVELVEELTQKDDKYAMAALVRVKCSAPGQDEHLPYQWEMISHQAGLQLMRAIFRLGIEKSDLELVLSLRAGENGEGIVRKGKRAYRFKTIFGSVSVPRIRIKYKGSGRSATPSSRAWKLPRQVYLSRGLKNAVSNIASKETYGETLKEIERETGEAGIISKSSVLNIVHQAGEKLSAAEMARAKKIFAEDERAKALLGRAASHLGEDYFAGTWLPNEDLETMDVQEAYEKIVWEPAIVQAPEQRAVELMAVNKQLMTTANEPNAIEQIIPATNEGEPSAATNLIVSAPLTAAVITKISSHRDQIDQNQDQSDKTSVAMLVGTGEIKSATEQIIVQLDEIITRKQPGGKRDSVIHYSGTVKTAARTYYCHGSSAAQLIYQVASLLAQLGMHNSDKKLLVLSDCAGWINNWVTGLGIEEKQSILCWWHLRAKSRELIGEAFSSKEDRDVVRKIVLKHLWRGRVDKALSYLKKLIEEAEDGISKLVIKEMGKLMRLKNYLIRRKPYIVDYQERRKQKEWIASTQVEKFNDHAISSRCKGRGSRWTANGVRAIAALETARRNGELSVWQREGKLPNWPCAA